MSRSFLDPADEADEEELMQRALELSMQEMNTERNSATGEANVPSSSSGLTMNTEERPPQLVYDNDNEEEDEVLIALFSSFCL